MSENPYKALSEWLNANQGDITKEDLEQIKQDYGIGEYDLRLSPAGTTSISIGYAMRNDQQFTYRRQEERETLYKADTEETKSTYRDTTKTRYDLEIINNDELNATQRKTEQTTALYKDIPYIKHSYLLNIIPDKLHLASQLITEEEIKLRIVPHRDKNTGEEKDTCTIYLQMGDDSPSKTTDCEIYTKLKDLKQIENHQSKINNKESKLATLEPKQSKEIEDNDLILYKIGKNKNEELDYQDKTQIGEGRTINIRRYTLHPDQKNKSNLIKAINNKNYPLVKLLINSIGISHLILTTNQILDDKTKLKLEKEHIILKKKSERNPDKPTEQKSFKASNLEVKLIYQQLKERENKINNTKTITRPRRKI